MLVQLGGPGDYKGGPKIGHPSLEKKTFSKTLSIPPGITIFVTNCVAPKHPERSPMSSLNTCSHVYNGWLFDFCTFCTQVSGLIPQLNYLP